jgi:NAD(P)-dependent dehydrogenase (short-subunit alcohol dehydrogenase family)
MGSLDGKAAVVTGAGAGVGRGIALALASEGASVALLGRSPGPLAEVATEIEEQGGTAVPLTCDVGDLERVPDVVAAAADALGGIDILVNNAWSGVRGPLLGMDLADFETGFRTGPFATFAFMKACHPHLQKSADGNVVNLVSATMVRWDSSGFGSYAAAKAAVRTLTRTAAAEWGPDGIRVNCIAPLALSPGMQRWVDEAPVAAEQFLATVPLGRVGDCRDDIGRAVALIVGPDARYLTGATIPLDGGQAHF